MDMPKKKLRILLIKSDAADADEFQTYVRAVDDMEVVGRTSGASEGLRMVSQLRPDGVVLDLELMEGDGLDFLTRLEETPVWERPYVVVTTNMASPMTLQAARDHGAGFVLQKRIQGYGSRQVADKFRMVQGYLGVYKDYPPAVRLSEAQEEHIREELALDLGQMGITPKLQGYRYIIDAVVLMIKSPDSSFDVSRKIYPAVAMMHQKQTANVERCIRTAIETAWVNTPPEVLHRIYTAAVRQEKGKPMNKEFLCFFALKYGKK